MDATEVSMTEEELRGVLTLMGYVLLIEPSVNTVGHTYIGVAEEAEGEDGARIGPIRGYHRETRGKAVEAMAKYIAEGGPDCD